MGESQPLIGIVPWQFLPFSASGIKALLGWRAVTSDVSKRISNIQRNLAGIDRERIGKWLGYAVESIHGVSMNFAINELWHLRFLPGLSVGDRKQDSDSLAPASQDDSQVQSY
jgi:hypothetical protein